MEYKIYYTKMADLDIDDIIDYIARDNPQNAIQFVSTLQEKIEETLSIFPKAGVSYGSVRHITFGNYVVVYEIVESTKSVYIILVSQGSRQWKAVLTDRL